MLTLLHHSYFEQGIRKHYDEHRLHATCRLVQCLTPFLTPKRAAIHKPNPILINNAQGLCQHTTASSYAVDRSRRNSQATGWMGALARRHLLLCSTTLSPFVRSIFSNATFLLQPNCSQTNGQLQIGYNIVDRNV